MRRGAVLVALTACSVAACGGSTDTRELPDAAPEGGDATVWMECPPTAMPDAACAIYDAVCTYPVRSGEYVGCYCASTPNLPNPRWHCSQVLCPSFVPAGGSACSAHLVGAECPLVGDCTCVIEYPQGPRWQCPGG